MLALLATGCLSAEPPEWVWYGGDWRSENWIQVEATGDGRLIAVWSSLETASVDLLDGEGRPVWSRPLVPDGGYLSPSSVAVGGDGTIYVGGSFSGTVSFGDGDQGRLSRQTCTWDPCTDGFVAAYDRRGQLRWVWRPLEAGSRDAHIDRVVVAPGAVYVAGRFRQRLATGGGGSFVIRLDEDGGEVWRRWDTVDTHIASVRDMLLDVRGDLVLAIDYWPADWSDQGAFTALMRMTAEGSEVWRREAVVGLLVATDDGDILMAGEFAEPIQIGARALQPVGGGDLYVVRQDGATGELRWVTHLGGRDAWLGVRDLQLDPAGDLVLVGSFGGRLTVGPSLVEAAGEADLFIARIRGGSGQPLAGAGYGTPRRDEGHSLAVLGRDDLVIAGHFTGELPIGGGIAVPPRGPTDVFVRRGDPFVPM